MATVLNRLEFIGSRRPALPPLILYQLVFLSSHFSGYTHASWDQPSWKRDQALHIYGKNSMKVLNMAFYREVANLTNEARFSAYLDNICISRPVQSKNHRYVANYIRHILTRWNYAVEFQEFSASTVIGHVQFRNIIATLNPYAHRRLTLACHYDSKLFNFEFIGATDSAVPCAILLDIAETLSPYIYKASNSNVTLQLVFFDGEEAFHEWTHTDSLYGSRFMAHQWGKRPYPFPFNRYGTSELDRMDVLVLLDLLGAKNPTVPNYLHNFSPTYELLASVEQGLLAASLLNGKRRVFTGERSLFDVDDDHRPFRDKGVNVVHLIPQPFPRVWHRASDSRVNLHAPTINDLSTIFRVFVSCFLDLDPKY